MAVTSIIAGAGLALSAFGTMSSVFSQRSAAANARAQGEASAANARAVAEQQAGVYLYNAKVAEANGKAAQDAATLQALRQREKSKGLLATQRAAYANAGVDIGEGSPLLVAEDTAARGEFDALIMEHEGNMGLWRSENEAKRLRYAADTSRAGGDAAAYGFSSAGDTRGDSYSRAAGTTLLTGLGQVAEQAWKRWGKGPSYPGGGGRVIVPDE
jgi:hypothetical protein